MNNIDFFDINEFNYLFLIKIAVLTYIFLQIYAIYKLKRYFIFFVVKIIEFYLIHQIFLPESYPFIVYKFLFILIIGVILSSYKILKKEFTFREGLLFILYFSMVFSIFVLILMYTVILNSLMFILGLFFDWVFNK